MAERGSLDRPESLGEALKALREKAGIELEVIAEETKVSRRVFEALENGRYQILPEKVFCRNFLRQYLEMIGADPGPWLRRFDLAWDHFEESSGTFRKLEVEAPPKVGVNWNVWFPVIAGVLIILGLLTVVALGSKSKQVLPPDPRRSSVERATPVRSLSTPTPFAVPVEVETALPETEGGLINVLIRVRTDRECWVHYRDRNGRTGQELLLAGSTRPIELEGPALLTLGNADAATIVVGGREYSNLGRAGQVVHFEIDENGLSPLEQGAAGG